METDPKKLLKMKLKDAMVNSAAGNPGAVRVLIELHNHYGEQITTPLCIAIPMTKSESWALWVVYKDICKYDLKNTRDYLKLWYSESVEPLHKFIEKDWQK